MPVELETARTPHLDERAERPALANARRLSKFGV
jgi:hypothetical protein